MILKAWIEACAFFGYKRRLIGGTWWLSLVLAMHSIPKDIAYRFCYALSFFTKYFISVFFLLAILKKRNDQATVIIPSAIETPLTPDKEAPVSTRIELHITETPKKIDVRTQVLKN